MIICDQNIMMGKATIEGTRITVEHILEQLAGGRSIGDLVFMLPNLTRPQVLEALAYAVFCVRDNDLTEDDLDHKDIQVAIDSPEILIVDDLNRQRR